ncbi:energy transducer TonB [Crenobacter caeni]|uniref:TonB family protein n=1 Tax=Crenobacter caeni TaxID=2705474 RepID=A0A6B2KVJ8_9NEIS|nr:energy transducer TonB [Crenobacter caeni]NDV14168.1 TonB family protein [Crenobacter caeni]
MKRNYFVLTTLATVTLGHAVLLYAADAPPLQPPEALPVVAVALLAKPAPAVAAQPAPAAPAQAKPAAPARRVPAREVAAKAKADAPRPASAKPAATAPAVASTAPAASAGAQSASGERQGAPATGEGDAPALTPPQYRGDYLHNPKPAYPPLSLELAEQGVVELRVAVSAAGEATSVELFRSSGFPRLDRAAREAVARWRFIPARLGSQSVAHSFVVPVHFSLKTAKS